MEKEKVIGLILKSEGGLNEQEPASVGGVSYSGITQKAYEAFLPKIQETYPDAPESVRSLEAYHTIVVKFYDLYLDTFNVWILPEFLQFIYADFVVNAGSAAVKIIQKMAGCDVDGVFGSGTRRAVEAWTQDVTESLKKDPSVDNDLIMQFHEAKLSHYDRLIAANPAKFQKWEKGWKRRANHVLSELSEYFETHEGTPSAMDDADVPTRETTVSPEHADVPNHVSDTLLGLQRDVHALDARINALEKKANKKLDF